MSSPTYEALIADAPTEGFGAVVQRVSRRIEEPGQPIHLDVLDPRRLRPWPKERLGKGQVTA